MSGALLWFAIYALKTTSFIAWIHFNRTLFMEIASIGGFMADPGIDTGTRMTI